MKIHCTPPEKHLGPNNTRHNSSGNVSTQIKISLPKCTLCTGENIIGQIKKIIKHLCVKNYQPVNYDIPNAKVKIVPFNRPKIGPSCVISYQFSVSVSLCVGWTVCESISNMFAEFLSETKQAAKRPRSGDDKENAGDVNMTDMEGVSRSEFVKFIGVSQDALSKVVRKHETFKKLASKSVTFVVVQRYEESFRPVRYTCPGKPIKCKNEMSHHVGRSASLNANCRPTTQTPPRKCKKSAKYPGVTAPNKAHKNPPPTISSVPEKQAYSALQGLHADSKIKQEDVTLLVVGYPLGKTTQKPNELKSNTNMWYSKNHKQFKPTKSMTKYKGDNGIRKRQGCKMNIKQDVNKYTFTRQFQMKMTRDKKRMTRKNMQTLPTRPTTYCHIKQAMSLDVVSSVQKKCDVRHEQKLNREDKSHCPKKSKSARMTRDLTDRQMTSIAPKTVTRRTPQTQQGSKKLRPKHDITGTIISSGSCIRRDTKTNRQTIRSRRLNRTIKNNRKPPPHVPILKRTITKLSYIARDRTEVRWIDVNPAPPPTTSYTKYITPNRVGMLKSPR